MGLIGKLAAVAAVIALGISAAGCSSTGEGAAAAQASITAQGPNPRDKTPVCRRLHGDGIVLSEHIRQKQGEVGANAAFTAGIAALSLANSDGHRVVVADAGGASRDDLSYLQGQMADVNGQLVAHGCTPITSN
ncbi:hypothetical protein [Methylovirgula sp. 4M-Z18]|uniref:hypothetical protein n=1 Tax=Methylovirgula sp. 4M-Z18 TaxID=2293567 RepID=UPI000E2F8A18|nr:hypothetical protein [Methylovirgula sp. 4M-Z18]RFB80570.1 hypothetical protein DYH55_03440 [Methylovirgula sp. 4M-Z18]